MTNSNFYKSKEVYAETFYQLPKILFTNKKYSKLSNDSKVAYALLKDRFNYSIRNNWVDEEDNIYFTFTNAEFMQLLNCGEKKIIRIKNELIDSDLLYQKRMGLNKPNRLYLLRPEVEATDVYTQAYGNKQAQSPATSGTVKMIGNQYKEQVLDTNRYNKDTDTLDFSTSNYSKAEIEKQDSDLVKNADEFLSGVANGEGVPFEPEAIKLISYWVRTPEQMQKMIGIILNAKAATEKAVEAQTGKPLTIILDLDKDLQKRITSTLIRLTHQTATPF